MLAGDRARAVSRALAGWMTRGGPMYVALADAISQALAVGEVPAHLPSERALAAALQVSRGTVANAYDVLRERGVVDRQRGSGSVARPRRPHTVCPDPLACVRAFFA